MKRISFGLYLALALFFLFSGRGKAEVFRVEKPPREISVIQSRDVIAASVVKIPGTEKFPGEDHMLLTKDKSKLIVFGMDQVIRQIDLIHHTTSVLGNSPGVIGGAQLDPLKPSRIVFCASNPDQGSLGQSEWNGVYEMDLENEKAQIRPLLLRVLKTPRVSVEKYYSQKAGPWIEIEKLQGSSLSRNFGICDDLAFSKDGLRLYITEPYDTPGGGFGDEISGIMNQREILMASTHGHLWMLNRETNSLHQIGTGLAFPDGIAVDAQEFDGITDEVLFTQLSRYRLSSLKVGPNQVEERTLFKNLPGMPNAMEFDEQGRLYLAFNKMRTKTLDFMLNFPVFRNFFKELVLRLPQRLKPIPKETGFLVLKKNKWKQWIPSYFTVHSGSSVTSIAHVLPDLERKKLYLSLFDSRSFGVHEMKLPLELCLGEFPEALY